MFLYSNIYFTFLYSIILILINFYILKKVSNTLAIDNKITNLVFFNHLIFTIIFLLNDFFSFLNFTPGSDSLSFYFNSDQKVMFEKIPFNVGHEFLYFLVFYLKKLFFDFISSYIFFGILGSLSILIFYASISKYFANRLDKYLVVLLILLPSYNFWTSGISKDVLTALALSLALLSFSKNNFKFLFLSIILLFLTRIHIALLVNVSFLTSTFFLLIFGLIFKDKIYLYNFELKKKYVIIFFSIILILTFWIVKKYFYLNLLNFESTIYHFQTMYPGKNYLETTFFLLRFFEYLVRPYPWEYDNIIINILSIENILIVSLLIFYSLAAIKEYSLRFRFQKYNLKIFILLSFILICIFQVILTSNIGIAMRQKWTFLPGLFFIMIYCKFYFISNKFNKIKKE